MKTRFESAGGRVARNGPPAKKRRTFLQSIRPCLPAVVILCFGSSLRSEPVERFAYEKAEMGLPFRVTLYAANEASAKAAADAAFARIALLNGILSDYDPESELSRLSRTSGSGKAVPVSQDLWNVLAEAQALATRTDGAFDVTVGPLVNLWRRARRKRELPSAELIAEMKGRVGWQQMKLDEAARTVTLLLPEMRLDCASLAKGYAIDAALALLRDRGFPQALVAGGGDMAAGDAPPMQQGWRIEVASLDASGAPPSQIVLLENSAIGTSGDAFQHLEVGGVRYSHIVDPKTGLGLTGRSLVTVLAKKCSVASSYATALSVLGPERGLALIEATPGLAARILREQNSRIEFVRSSRWPQP